MSPPVRLQTERELDVGLPSGSSHSLSSTSGIPPNSSHSLASGSTSVASTPASTPRPTLSKRFMSRSMSARMAKFGGSQHSCAVSDDDDSKCSNMLSSSVHSNKSITDQSQSQFAEQKAKAPTNVVPMTPTASPKVPYSQNRRNHKEGKSLNTLSDDRTETPVSLGVPNTTPDTSRTRGSVGAKISGRVNIFEANPLDGALLSPMQMHAPAPSFSIGVPRLVGNADEDELILSPMHVPKSVPTKRRSVRHKKIEVKAQVFDSPAPQNNFAARVLLSPQEVRELVKSSNTNHRLDQILYRYEHLSEEESKERRRLAAKIAAKERRRRLGSSTNDSEARRLAWEQSRANFRNGTFTSPTLLVGDETGDITDDVFDGVRAVRYDFSSFTAPSFPKTDLQEQLILDAVGRDFPFAEFCENGKARTDGAIEAIVGAFNPIRLQANEILLHQGVKEGNDRYYIMECGTIDIQQEGVSINQLCKVGDSFGQIALMYHQASNVTISVASSSEVQGSEAGAHLLSIDQKTYRGLLLEYSQKARTEKINALFKVKFLKDIVDGDDVLCNKLASAMVRREFKTGDIFTANEEATFFVVLSGAVRVISNDGSYDEVLRSGSHFGEKSLIKSRAMRTVPSTESDITAQAEGILFSIDKKNLERVLGRGRLQNLQDMRTLASTALVKKAKLTRSLRDKMASKITELKLDGEKKKQWKVEKTQKPELYIVREGSVLVSYKDEESGKECKNEVKAGETFGHEQVKAVASNDVTKFRRIGGLTTSSTSEKTASIGIIPLEEAGPLSPTKRDRPPLPSVAHKSSGVVASKTSIMPPVATPKRVLQDSPAIQLRKKLREAVQSNLTLDQLEKVRLLGEGEFGEVWMVSADVFETGVQELRQNFALKAQLRRDESRGKDASADILREIQLLKEIDHPQVVDLVTTFEDKDAIHILMGLIPGGELWDVIHTEDDKGNWRSGMPENQSKFVAMVLADTLDFIHSRDIVYRDLKPGK